jgi:hypothetical protein
MNRFLYFAGFAYIALCGAVVAWTLGQRLGRPSQPPVIVDRAIAVTPSQAPPPPSLAASPAEQWFASVKPYCNPVEVEVRTRYTSPPRTSEGAGYHAACFALAGKIDRARTIIEKIPAGDRGAAAAVLFNVAHPVADAGDDRASGPMMELVLEYWPNNYMALYHAGMSEYSLGQTEIAERHLRDFLGMYTAADGFTLSAREALGRIRAGVVGRKDVERETPSRP